VTQELDFLARHNTDRDATSPFIACFEFLCALLRKLSTSLSESAFAMKSQQLAPLEERSRAWTAKLDSVSKAHAESLHKLRRDQHELAQQQKHYASACEAEKARFQMIRLLAAQCLPPNDHRTLKKSWHSPSRTARTVSSLIKRAKSKMLEPKELKLNGSGSSGSEDVGAEDLSVLSDFEEATKCEVDEIEHDKEREHEPRLYAMWKYVEARNKLARAEQRVVSQAASVQHSLDSHSYVRREGMKAMHEQELQRVRQTKAVYLQFTEGLRSDSAPFKLADSAQFAQFEDAAKMLSAQQEFARFVDRAKSDATARYAPQKALNVTSMLTSWRTSRHLMEDTMHIQMTKYKIDRKTLSVPFVFEYLMEHLESRTALRDPDLFMSNPVAPSMADKARSFTYDSSLHPDLIHSAVADDIKEADARMKVDDIMALPVLTAQVEQLCRCQFVPICDHHHAANLLKLWLLRMPSPLLPMFVHGRVCKFMAMDTAQQRLSCAQSVLSELSAVRLAVLARLVAVLKKALKEQLGAGQMALIDLSYEVSNVILRSPSVAKDAWKALDAQQMGRLEVVLDPQSTYTAPLPPSHRQKRAEMAFVTFLLSNHVPMLNDVKVVNKGKKLGEFREQFMARKALDGYEPPQSKTPLARMQKPSIGRESHK